MKQNFFSPPIEIKSKKHLFNTLLLRYKKVGRKLKSLKNKQKNSHKQKLLKTRLDKLNNRLRILYKAIRGNTVTIALVGGLALATPSIGQAQTFAPPPFGLTDIGDHSNVAFADLDNDGDLDMMSGSFTNGDFYYFENTGTTSNPSFASVVINPFGLTNIGEDYSTPTFGDLDGDGDLDLMAGGNNGNFLYFQNMGTASSPSFTTSVTNPFSLVDIGTVSTPTFGDLDGDGDLDLMSGEANGEFYYFENIGTTTSPSFASVTTNPSGLTDIGDNSAPTYLDLDNDGDLDIMAGERGGEFYYFENTGTASSPSFATVATSPFNLPDIGFHSMSAFGDLDGDGDLDMISGINTGEFLYFENTSSISINFASFTNNPFNLVDIGDHSTVTFVDLDNDGDMDIMSGGYVGGEFYYFENTGTVSSPNFEPVVTNPFGLTDIGENYSTPTFADLDGDGDLDLMSGGYSGNFYYFENIGTTSSPNFTTLVSNPFGLVDIGFNSIPDFEDIDGDGDLDMISGTATGNFRYFENEGTSSSPSFGMNQNNPFGLSNIGLNSIPNLIDFDNDGDLDLMAGERGGEFYYFENAGTASSPNFNPTVTNPFNLSDIGFHSAPDFVDLDNDGKLDMMSGINTGGGAYFENISTFSSNFTLLTFENPFGLTGIIGNISTPTFVDLDGDGDLDLMSGQVYGDFLYFENTGTASSPNFNPAVTNPFGLTDIGDYSTPTFVDLDGDGDLDLMTGELYGSFLYFENTGTASSPNFASVITNPFNLSDIGYLSFPTFVDLDGDGDLDLMSGELFGDFYYFENTGTTSSPNFASAITNPFNLSDIGDISSPIFIDLDGDGNLDMMSGSFNSGNFFYFENTGTLSSPSFAPVVTNPFEITSINGNLSKPTFGDIDGDGDLDLMSGSFYNGNFYYFENRTESNSSLPITLLSFEAERQGMNVILGWTTASEKDNAGFEIQMSEDGRNFQKVAFMEGAGNSTKVKSYEFLVNNSQSAYYRLKQVDFDGRFSYSPIRFVKGFVLQEEPVLYPNPTSGKLYLKNIDSSKNLIVNIFDIKGERLETLQGTKLEVEVEMSKKIESLHQGIYIICLQTFDKIYYRRIIKE